MGISARVVARPLRRIARLGAGVAVAAAAVVVALAVVAGILLWAAQESWNPTERRDAASRCPQRSEAAEVEVDIGGWGEPDWCVYRDEAGREIGDALIAVPILNE